MCAAHGTAAAVRPLIPSQLYSVGGAFPCVLVLAARVVSQMIYIRTHTRAHATRTHTHTRARARACPSTHTHARTRTDACARAHTHARARTHTRARTRAHTRTHAHAQTANPPYPAQHIVTRHDNPTTQQYHTRHSVAQHDTHHRDNLCAGVRVCMRVCVGAPHAYAPVRACLRALVNTLMVPRDLPCVRQTWFHRRWFAKETKCPLCREDFMPKQRLGA